MTNSRLNMANQRKVLAITAALTGGVAVRATMPVMIEGKTVHGANGGKRHGAASLKRTAKTRKNIRARASKR